MNKTGKKRVADWLALIVGSFMGLFACLELLAIIVAMVMCLSACS